MSTPSSGRSDQVSTPSSGGSDQVSTPSSGAKVGASSPVSGRWEQRAAFFAKWNQLGGFSTKRAVVVALVVSALALTLALPLRTYFTQRTEAERVAVERQRLEQQVQELGDKKRQLEDPAYLQAQARERLQFVMPGETPYKVQLPGSPPGEDAAETPKSSAGDPWYTDLWNTVASPTVADAAPTVRLDPIPAAGYVGSTG